MPTLRSHSVGTGKASPCPAATATTATTSSPGSRKKKGNASGSKSKNPVPAIVPHPPHSVLPALALVRALDPVTPAGDREHALSSASLRPLGPQTRGVIRTRQSLGQKKLLFSEQQQLQQQEQDHANEGAEEPEKRSSKRVRRAGVGASSKVVLRVAMEEKIALPASEETDEKPTALEKGKRKLKDFINSDGESDSLIEADVDSSDNEAEALGRDGSSSRGGEGNDGGDGGGGVGGDGANPSYATRGSGSSRQRKEKDPVEPNSRVEATRAKFLEIARRRAAHFAHFTGEEDEPTNSNAVNNSGDEGRSVDEQKRRADELLAQVSADAGRTDNNDGQNQWPGPFVIARQLVEGREAAAVARHESSSRGADPQTKSSVEWVPSRKTHFKKSRAASSLHTMCIDVLCANIEHVQSLVGVTDAAKKSISSRLCSRRSMTTSSFGLYFSSEPGEVFVPDCTFVTEEILTEALAKCSTEKLEVLELGMCGRAMSDQVCVSVLAGSACSLPALHTLVLNGAYRLTDIGLKALVQAAPNLLSLNLKQCNMISAAGLEAVADSLGGTLRNLSVESCSQLDALRILPPLLRMSGLKSLCLSGLGGMSDGIVSEMAVILGPHLLELFLADCKALTDSAIRAISLCCTGLELLDIGHLPSLTDAAIGSLADGCRLLKTLRLDRGKFSDTTLAALITASGSCLSELSLNSVRQASDLTVSALAKHSKGTLERLDMSFCRGVSDQALGLLADTCASLQEIRLFGCTQITNVFVQGHSNPSLNLIGLPNCGLDGCSSSSVPPRRKV